MTADELQTLESELQKRGYRKFSRGMKLLENLFGKENLKNHNNG